LFQTLPLQSIQSISNVIATNGSDRFTDNSSHGKRITVSNAPSVTDSNIVIHARIILLLASFSLMVFAIVQAWILMNRRKSPQRATNFSLTQFGERRLKFSVLLPAHWAQPPAYVLLIQSLES
jgi:hypothetical protein